MTEKKKVRGPRKPWGRPPLPEHVWKARWEEWLRKTAGRKAPELPPLPVYALVREEGLRLRLHGAVVWDPQPTGFGMKVALEAALPETEILHRPGEPWQLQMPMPAFHVISAPSRSTMGMMAAHCIDQGASYMALYIDMAQLGGLQRLAGLYGPYPPNRIYVLAEQWMATKASRAGSAGSWRPAVWAVWDGGESPIQNRRLTPMTTLQWLPDRSSGL
jgi:hypothetical protein